VGAFTVAVPLVVLFKPTEPAKTAFTVPACTSYAALLVRAPGVAPLSVPPVIWNVPIDFESVPMFRVPALTV